MAAADEAELCHMVHTMALHDSGPIAVRYPRGEGRGVPLAEQPQALEIGKGRIVREGKTVAILSLGTRLAEAEKAADELEAQGTFDDGRRPALRQAARQRADPQAADHP